jgi:prepilin-type N-terminal cleavage/methylation domain-containing protein
MQIRSSQKGFTLIETMVAMGLLSVAITLSMNFINTQLNSRKVRTIQSMHRYIAIQVTQHINTNLTFYPPISPPGFSFFGIPILTFKPKIIYVGCFTKDGILIENKFHFNSFSGFGAFNEQTPINGLSYCPPTKSFYQVRFFWLPPDPNSSTPTDADSVKINIITFNPGTNKSLAVHNFKIFAK